jgi:hypothetical protein
MERDDGPALVSVKKEAETPEWQQKVFGFIVQYCRSAEVNFVLTIKKGLSVIPTPSDQAFMVDKYLNGISGLYVVLINKFCRVDLEMEEVAVKTIRKKFAEMRSALIKQALTKPGGTLPPAPGTH